MTASRSPHEGREFASFWHGTLNPFAYACLASFAQAGAKSFHLLISLRSAVEQYTKPVF